MIRNITSTAIAKQDDEGLSATAHSLARRIPPSFLPALVASGLAAGSAIAFYRPHWWILGSMAVVVAACALWGMAERAISEIDESNVHDARVAHWAYLVLRGYAFTAATLAGILFLVFAFGLVFKNIGVGGG